jgi:hypothetical protein
MDYFIIAKTWDRASQAEIEYFKKHVSNALGYPCRVLCRSEWVSGKIIDVYVQNANTKLLADHLRIHDTGLFTVAATEYYADGLDEPTDERIEAMVTGLNRGPPPYQIA